jgi:hypothetical protein
MFMLERFQEQHPASRRWIATPLAIARIFENTYFMTIASLFYDVVCVPCIARGGVGPVLVFSLSCFLRTIQNARSGKDRTRLDDRFASAIR